VIEETTFQGDLLPTGMGSRGLDLPRQLRLYTSTTRCGWARPLIMRPSGKAREQKVHVLLLLNLILNLSIEPR
jgi:hypothetical protein